MVQTVGNKYVGVQACLWGKTLVTGKGALLSVISDIWWQQTVK